MNSRTNLDVASARRYLGDIDSIPLLTAQEEKALYKRLPDPTAQEELVRRNMRYAALVAGKYRWSRMPLCDLISYAIMGLYEAARRFDPSRGVKFITYADHWIRRIIQNSVADFSREVRVPQSAQRQALARRRPISQRYVSIDEPPHLQDSWTLAETLRATDPELGRAASRISMSWLSERAATKLTDRERLILRARFGDQKRSLQDLGREMGLSKERVRQIQNEALRKLRRAAGAAA